MEDLSLKEKVLIGLIGYHFRDGERTSGSRGRSVTTVNDITTDFAHSVVENKVFYQASISTKSLGTDPSRSSAM